MKHFITLLLTIFLTTSAFAQSFNKTLEPQDNQLVIYVASCDWGACINKIILKSWWEENDESSSSDFSQSRMLDTTRFCQGKRYFIPNADRAVKRISSRFSEYETPFSPMISASNFIPLNKQRKSFFGKKRIIFL